MRDVEQGVRTKRNLQVNLSNVDHFLIFSPWCSCRCIERWRALTKDQVIGSQPSRSPQFHFSFYYILFAGNLDYPSATETPSFRIHCFLSNKNSWVRTDLSPCELLGCCLIKLAQWLYRWLLLQVRGRPILSWTGGQGWLMWKQYYLVRNLTHWQQYRNHKGEWICSLPTLFSRFFFFAQGAWDSFRNLIIIRTEDRGALILRK